jgi:hypothetical protein
MRTAGQVSRIVAAAAMAIVMVGSPVKAQQADREAELERRIQELETFNSKIMGRLNELESRQEANWLNERRSEEVKALVREVLQDSDTRASLQEEAMTAGHNGSNFYLASADGNFLLQIAGLLQVRYVYNLRGGDPPANTSNFPSGFITADEERGGFEFSRAKLEFAGHIGSPRFQYLIRWGPDREDNEVLGERIVIGYEVADGLTLWGGEDKAAFLREEVIDPGRQLAVERSLMNEVFTAGYVQGIWLTWEATDSLNVYASLNDGFRSGEADNEYNSQFIFMPDTGGSASGAPPIHKPFDLDGTDFAVTARIDWKVLGQWQQYQDFAAWEGEETAVFLGGAVHWQQGESGSGDDNDNFFAWTIDASAECNNFNLFLAFAGLHSDFEERDNRDLYGAVIQAGYMVIPNKLEPFIRYEWIDLDSSAVSDDQINLVTFGVNYYIIRHQAKFTFDVVWALDPIPMAEVLGVQDNDGTNQTLGSLGLLPDDPNDEDQFSLRAQFQLMF